MKKIYFDHSATTPVDEKVLQEMLPYFNNVYGNASSLHSFGQEAIIAVDKARLRLSKFLNCDPCEIIFTGGATESNNLAIRGLVEALYKEEKLHIITSEIEHDAILEPIKKLISENKIEADYLPVDNSALVLLDKLDDLIKEKTVLVSVMYVNSEVGTVEPIREIGKKIKKINEKRLKDWKNTRVSMRGEKPQKIYFHVDATQGVNFYNTDVTWNYIDLLSLSAHKIYGPKGVGAFYKKEEVPMKAIQFGGHHENNLRSGTLNVAGIVGLGSAIKQLTKDNQEKNNKKIEKLRNMLIDGILKKIPKVVLNTNKNISSPSHAHFSFLGIEGESLLMMLDFEGIAVSTGSACASGSLVASHVLLAMGIKQEIAHNSIRFTLGKNNTKDEIKKVLEVLPPIVEKLRKINPLFDK